MSKKELRGLTTSSSRRELTQESWESLDVAGKVKRSLMSMTKPEFVQKKGQADGADALILKIEKEPGLAGDISATPEGREAIVYFIEELYRSEDAGRSAQRARRALHLLSFNMSLEERAKIRDAELDCRAYVMATDPYPDSSWLEGLTGAERLEVDRRAEVYRSKI